MELVARDSKMRDELESLCKFLGIEFLETFTDLDASFHSGKTELKDWFQDPNEGIHFTSKALNFTAQKVQERIEGEGL